MSISRWFSLQVLIGGSVIALVAVSWGIITWDIPLWSFYIFAIPFVFFSALAQRRRVHIYILCVFMLVHAGVNVRWLGKQIFTGEELVDWGILLLASEIIYQISSQSRRANEATRRRINELEVMNETLAEISSDLELSTLLQTIVERAVNLLNVSTGELLLFDKQTREMEIVAQYPGKTNQIGFKMKPGEGSMGRVAVTQRPLILNDYKAFVNSMPDKIASGVEATMDVPLLKGGELIGVLGVARHNKNRKFTEDDQRLLTVFASQATIAIENARLYQEVQHLAFTDVLTGINNRRRLFELVEKEYKRAVRYCRPLSFMIVDIDYFKSINDRYGHAAGDEALRWFATECSLVIRQNIDVIGRFGGEEFALIYPETGLPAAISAAGRLHQHFIDKQVCFEEHEIKFTFSAGIASLPDNALIGWDQLIERADKALYFAKEKRDCMAYWDNKDGKPQFIEK